MIGSDYKPHAQVGEHFISLPPLPKNKNEILFVDEKDAYWRRDILINKYKPIWFDFIPYHTKLFQDATLYDNDGILISLNTDDSKYIISTYEIEMRRRRDGVFMKNGKDIIHLTGDYWFMLMWCKTKRPDKRGDFFDHRRFQREFFYLIKYTNTSPNIWGLGLSKAKKTGITNLMWLYYLNKYTMTKNINGGNMNIDQDKGAKTFRDHFLYAYNGLPAAFKPQWKSKSEQEGRITFGKQYNNSKKNRLIINDAEDELNTTVMCVPTLPHAFDVDVFEDTWYDEPPKYKQDFGEIYRSNNAATSLQDFQVGKIWWTSYTPEESGLSFFSTRQLFFDSELRTITPDSNKQTKSKLICHHIPAYCSWTTSFDKLGECDEKDAMQKIQFGRDQLRSRPRELQAETRKYANSKKEAWSTGGVGSVFNNIRFAELLSELEIDHRGSPDNPYQEGRLEWTEWKWEIGNKNKRPKGHFSPVKFVPLTKEEKERGETGRYRLYYPIPDNHCNIALKYGRDQEGNLLAPPRFLYVGAFDPTNYAAASEVIEGSKNASMTFNMPSETTNSIYREIMSKILVGEYFHRPELPEEAFEDCLKEIIWLGKLSIIEANTPYFATRLMEEGLGNYMFVRDKNGVMVIWQRWMGMAHEEDKVYQLIRVTANSQSNREMLESMVRVIKNYFEPPPPNEKDYGKTFKSTRFIKQAMDFDATDTRLYDLVMCGGEALLCMEIYFEILLAPKEDVYASANIYSVLNAFAR